MTDHPMMKRAYHVDGGAKEMYAVDAEAAVTNHPEEWAWMPFSATARDNYRAKVAADYKKAVADAQAAGVPPPPPPAIQPDFTPTPAERREIDEDTAARAKAAELVRMAEEKERKEKEEADKIAAAKALLKSPPPEIDPNARRPGRPSNAELAARAAAEKEAADKAVADKKKADDEAKAAKK